MKGMRLKDIEFAVALYYSKPEIGTQDIKQLFGLKTDSSALKLKKQAREQMAKEDVIAWNALCVDTECAYKAWKLDIKKLELMCSKLKKYGLTAVK